MHIVVDSGVANGLPECGDRQKDRDEAEARPLIQSSSDLSERSPTSSAEVFHWNRKLAAKFRDPLRDCAGAAPDTEVGRVNPDFLDVAVEIDLGVYMPLDIAGRTELVFRSEIGKRLLLTPYAACGIDDRIEQSVRHIAEQAGHVV